MAKFNIRVCFPSMIDDKTKNIYSHYLDVEFRCHSDCTEEEIIEKFLKKNKLINYKGKVYNTHTAVYFEIENINE